ncbi:MAG: hypothetical protein H0T47_23585 [Planctomycetaceae bacterium]|nr:hypothetical protein [Planctomycetaceae bacterium]
MVPCCADAGVGDPQVRTDHDWYPGELACSTFERLFATQAAQFERVTGARPVTDEQKALASWLWRNTHYFHGEEGAQDLWGQGFTTGGDLRTRDYWTGQFAHGFGLCGTTHSQWTAELDALLGHTRSRGVGVTGHNSLEVFLTGGVYGDGKWALLDHDLSTLIFDEDGKRLLSIDEVTQNWKRLTDRGYLPAKQQGWPVCGLHPGDGGVFQSCDVAEYLAGYAGPPPMVHLRRGETLRRYLEPGLEDGKTFVFWGRNSNTAGIPGPERSLTWVNQPEKLFGGTGGVRHQPGQARYGNAVYVYKPNFENGDYKEGVVEEADGRLIFEFNTPYIIAATPADDSPWGIYESGCTNGLVVERASDCSVLVSTDRGATWDHIADDLGGRVDLTDFVKGHRQYWLMIGCDADGLRDANLTISTVCQANPSMMPRLTDDGSLVSFAASGNAVVSAGPNLDHAAQHLIDGAFDSPKVTLELKTARGEPAVEVYAAAHVLSGNPPDPSIKYTIEYSIDAGMTWLPIVADWSIARRGENPPDFWSQSMCYGSTKLDEPTTGSVRIRFHNDGGRKYARCEAHLVYRTVSDDVTKVTFGWTEGDEERNASHVFAQDADADSQWPLPTGTDVKTNWVEFAPVAR